MLYNAKLWSYQFPLLFILLFQSLSPTLQISSVYLGRQLASSQAQTNIPNSSTFLKAVGSLPSPPLSGKTLTDEELAYENEVTY